MSSLISLIARAGVPERYRTLVAWIAVAGLVALLLWLLALAFTSWLHGREQQAVEIDRKDVTIEAANRVINATAAADAAQDARDEAFANQQQELRDAAHDKGSDDDVGLGTRAVLERMRQQQQAGDRGAAP